MKTAMGALALVDVLALVGILASPLLFFASIFSSTVQDQKATHGCGEWVLASGVIRSPAGVGGIMGLKAYKAGNAKRLLWWTLCSISSVALLAVSFLLLSILCKGQFSCQSA